MQTLLISSHDTSTGKTWVARNLVHYFSNLGLTVQFVKPIETGVITHPKKGNAFFVTKGLESNKVTSHTLHSFKAPLAPIPAAQEEGYTIAIDSLVEEILSLPKADIRILEGAGGLACPIDAKTHKDYKDLALKLKVDGLILVVKNRLGAMHHTRTLVAYAPTKDISTGLWINTVRPQPPRVNHSNLEAFTKLSLPIWGHQGPNVLFSVPEASFQKQFASNLCLA